MTDATLAPHTSKNLRMAGILAVIVLAMVGAAYAAVPIYQLFCQVTGFGGTTQTAAGNAKGIIDREMTVRFDSNVGGGLPWKVQPAAPITDKIGTVETVTFIAKNLSTKPVTGQAIFNVVPEQTGIYFNKIECFCFTEQTLQPGEEVEMPVTFFVDPDIAENGDLDTVRNITLSYTFYASEPEDR
jgi:cytochrome c oxidase assembly protein subunit 11